MILSCSCVCFYCIAGTKIGQITEDCGSKEHGWLILGVADLINSELKPVYEILLEVYH